MARRISPQLRTLLVLEFKLQRIKPVGYFALHYLWWEYIYFYGPHLSQGFLKILSKMFVNETVQFEIRRFLNTENCCHTLLQTYGSRSSKLGFQELTLTFHKLRIIFVDLYVCILSFCWRLFLVFNNSRSECFFFNMCVYLLKRVSQRNGIVIQWVN